MNLNLSESLEQQNSYYNSAAKIYGSGIKKFKTFAFELLDEHDIEVIPYLKSLYSSLYFLPEFKHKKDDMESIQEIDKCDLEEIQDEWENNFEFTSDDLFAIEIANNVIRKLLRRKNISPKNIIGIGLYLDALNRLPEKTKGLDVRIDITYENGDESFRESKTYSFVLTDENFNIEIKGHQYEAGVGSDSFEFDGWYVKRRGERDCKCDLYNLEETINEYLSLGAEISTSYYVEKLESE